MQKLSLYDAVRWGAAISGLSTFFYIFLLVYSMQVTPAIMAAISLCITLLVVFGLIWATFDVYNSWKEKSLKKAQSNTKMVIQEKL